MVTWASGLVSQLCYPATARSARPCRPLTDPVKLAAVVLTAFAASACATAKISPDRVDPKVRELSSLPVGLEVTHDPNPVKAQEGQRSSYRYTWLYRTAVRALGGPVRIEEFGSFDWEEGQWVFSAPTGLPFDAEDFARRYSCVDATVPSDRECVDSTNWAGSDSHRGGKQRWYFVGVDVWGTRMIGEGTIELLGEQRDRAFLSGALIAGVPVGEFADFVDLGLGFEAGVVVNVDNPRALGLRLDASFLEYGRDTRSVQLDDPLASVDLDITTTNSILSVGVGPQLAIPGRRIRPYVYGTLGFAYFETRSFVDGSDDSGGIESTLDSDDFTSSWSAGGGLLIRIVRGRHPVFIDLSATYKRNGRATYLREESIQRAPDGTLTITPTESQTNLTQFRVGVSVGV